MNKIEFDSELKDFLFFFPIKLNNFISFLFSFLPDGFPRGIGVLMLLKKHGSMPISKIGENLVIRKSNMTPIIDELEQKGFIRRCASPEDRRIINIELTESGENQLAKALNDIEKVIEDKCSVLTEEEFERSKESVRQLMDTMGKVIKKAK